MKKNVVVILGVLLLSTGVFAGGINNDPVSGLAVVNISGTKTYKIFYRNSEVNDVKVSIVNSKGNVVFSERINGVDGFVRPYNFAELANGEYTVQIEDNSGTRNEKISYHTGKVETLFNVIRLTQSNKYLVTAASKGEQTVNVKIYNNEGTVLYNESSKAMEAFAKVYKLDRVSGAVTFEISDASGLSKSVTF